MLAALFFGTVLFGTCMTKGTLADTVPNAGAMQAAYDYLSATDADTNIRRRVARFRSDAVVFLRTRGMSNDAAAACVDGVVMPGLSARTGELLQTWASVLLANLSADDLEAAALWERSPAAQRMHASMAGIIESMESARTGQNSSGSNAQPRVLPLATVEVSDADARDNYNFHQTPAGRHLDAVHSQISTSWNAATSAWQLRTMESLLGHGGAGPC